MTRAGRFVAGAQCPACRAVDRVKVDVEHGDRYWCVACGFEAKLPDTAASAAAPAVADRAAEAVLHVVADAVADETTVVRMVDTVRGPAVH